MVSTARLIIADSENCADLYWATKFFVPDPIPFIEHRGKKILIASDLEFSRAKREAEVDFVLPLTAYLSKISKNGNKNPTETDVIAHVLKERGVRRVEVPSYFPVARAEALRRHGLKVIPAEGAFYPERQIKTNAEKREVVKSLRATEEAIRFAIETLKKARARSGRLYLGKTTLTSERLRTMMEIRMLEWGCLGRHTIVAGGSQAADPHCVGTGPLFANQTIVLDVFPKSISSGYYGDITRTVFKGRASDRLRAMYEAVRRAQAKGISMVRDGINGKTVHDAVAAVLQKSGFRTENVGGKPQGFFHGTGHGLGLDLHEPPRVSPRPQILRKGNIVTVEPGLYYHHLGGIRIEDVVFITKTGCEVLTKLPRFFEI